MTSGGEDDASSGSDSEPSVDNLEEEEMAQVVPIKVKEPVKKIPVKPTLPPPISMKKQTTLIAQKQKKPQSPQDKTMLDG